MSSLEKALQLERKPSFLELLKITVAPASTYRTFPTLLTQKAARLSLTQESL